MTEERIAEIEALCAAATPGPWEARNGGNFTDFGTAGFKQYCDTHHDSSTHLKLGGTYVRMDNSLLNRSRTDAEFIAAARTALPEALAEIRRLRAALRGEAKKQQQEEKQKEE